MPEACAGPRLSVDVHNGNSPDSGGWIEILEGGALLILNAKTGWREVEIGRGSSATPARFMPCSNGCTLSGSTLVPSLWAARATENAG
ncbi:hypothetical protein P775_23325 [Puniceibacterium antarcticum]|uniref:Uncharacterized protein n=1 Tax=Puniceibacterium antarcticum TaxID=1206336 RepID=A0A2G8R853_9RHOB|nr:hypothetical protein P775_23325 [Puniceibacterium antarcticum]